MMTSLLAVFSVGLLLLGPPGPGLLRVTKPDKFPKAHEEPPTPGPTKPTPAKRPRIFGIGVGFDTSGTLSGVALKIVIADSPAYRAGLIVGCIVSEINGEATAGRTGEECARIIREGAGSVRLKYLDAAMRERTVTLEKEWILVPE